ncbi:MAG: hypothetical protein ACJAXK_000110 [Yoonia sp.]|jgi:hypothetical protein
MEFLSYMGEVFAVINFDLLLLATMAVALLILLTFKPEPQQDLILLGAA